MDYSSKFDKIIENNINGNISDCRALIKNFTKYQLLELLEYWTAQTGEGRHSVIAHLRVIV